MGSFLTKLLNGKDIHSDCDSQFCNCKFDIDDKSSSDEEVLTPPPPKRTSSKKRHSKNSKNLN